MTPAFFLVGAFCLGISILLQGEWNNPIMAWVRIFCRAFAMLACIIFVCLILAYIAELFPSPVPTPSQVEVTE